MSQFIINDQEFDCKFDRIGSSFFPRVQPEPHIPMTKALAFETFMQHAKFGYASSGKAELEMIRLLLSIS